MPVTAARRWSQRLEVRDSQTKRCPFGISIVGPDGGGTVRRARRPAHWAATATTVAPTRVAITQPVTEPAVTPVRPVEVGPDDRRLRAEEGHAGEAERDAGPAGCGGQGCTGAAASAPQAQYGNRRDQQPDQRREERHGPERHRVVRLAARTPVGRQPVGQPVPGGEREDHQEHEHSHNPGGGAPCRGVPARCPLGHVTSLIMSMTSSLPYPRRAASARTSRTRSSNAERPSAP